VAFYGSGKGLASIRQVLFYRDTKKRIRLSLSDLRIAYVSPFTLQLVQSVLVLYLLRVRALARGERRLRPPALSRDYCT